MDIYTRKRLWKLGLSVLGLVIIGLSLFYTSLIVRKFAAEERKNVKLWAEAVQRKARLVKYTEFLFEQLQDQERKRVELLANVYKELLSDDKSDYTFFTDIISNNNTIPVILTDNNGKIIQTLNCETKYDTLQYLKGNIKSEFTVYEPITVQIMTNKKQYLYYKDSRFFSELKSVLNNYVTSFMEEVALNSSSVPVIITDSTKQNVIMFGNLNDVKMSDPVYVHDKLEEMEDENDPLKVNLGEFGLSYIFYQDSELLTIIKFFPIAQILIVAVFALIAYLLFSFARRSEQNRVWAGMAKETAHQIGTPLSSIMAWVELLKEDGANAELVASQVEKDIDRLNIITERFSKIGSAPELLENDIIKILNSSIDYLRPRSSKKVEFIIDYNTDQEIIIPVNPPLLSWVFENIVKNAIDAMGGKGDITFTVQLENRYVIIDITDTGKGIPQTEMKAIFNPGYTSKKRGWGLGLTFSRRIVNEYHKGRIFVKSSTLGKGTTFRIMLKRDILLKNI